MHFPYAPSLEAIMHQHGDRWIEEGTKLINKLRDKDYDTTDALAEIDQLIFDRFGLKLSSGIDKSDFPNAYIHVEPISINNVILNEWRTYWIDETDMMKRLRKHNNVIKGEVDFEKAKVSGIFSEIELPTRFTSGLLESNIPAKQVLGVLTHEIGHAFTFFAALAHECRTNMAIAAISSDLMNANKKTIIEMSKYASKEFDLDENTLTETMVKGDTNLVAVQILAGSRLKLRSVLDSPDYDESSAEMMADQFASRMGLGEDVVKGLDKMYRDYGEMQLMNPFIFHCWNVLVSTMMLLNPFLLPFTILIGLAGGTLRQEYDNPKDRFERIKREYISRMKTAPNQKEKAALAATYKELQKIIDQYHGNNKFFFETVINFVFNRKGMNKKKQQQLLEKLGNNTLFASANELDLILNKA